MRLVLPKPAPQYHTPEQSISAAEVTLGVGYMQVSALAAK